MGWEITGSGLMVSGIKMDQRGHLIDREGRRIKTPGEKGEGRGLDFGIPGRGEILSLTTTDLFPLCLQKFKSRFLRRLWKKIFRRSWFGN